MAVGLVLTAFRPAIVAAYPPHNEWVTSPAEHGVRLAKVMGITLVLMALERAVRAPEKKAPFRVLGYFGTNSLGGYFFHLAFLYVGLFGVSFAAFWRDSCGWVAYAALTVALVAVTAAACAAWNALWEWLSGEVLRRWAALTGSAPRRSPTRG
jgi:hypothetical protein